MKHILSVLVENKSGVLSRVTGMISRRGFNIESLTVAPTEDSTMSRLTAIVNADEVGYEQITKQLHKLVSVYKITDLTDEDAIERELALFKVSAPPDRRHEIIEIANVFRANIVDVGKNSLTIEATGDESKLEAMENLFRAYGLKQLRRTREAILRRLVCPAGLGTRRNVQRAQTVLSSHEQHIKCCSARAELRHARSAA